MSAYSITPEFHVSPEVQHNGRRFPAVSFEYAIRREDGSLVFRTVTHEEADEILTNLTEQQKQAA